MRLLVIIRTAFIFHVRMCACFAFSSSTGQDMELDGSRRFTMTSIIPLGAANHSIVPKGSIFYMQANESRGSEGSIAAQMSKEVPHLSLSLGLKIPKPSLNGVTNDLEQLELAAIAGKFCNVKNMLSEEKWRILIKTPAFPWKNNVIRNGVYDQWLNSYISPVQTFRYMKVYLMYSPEDTRSMDPKLLWWFDYIIKYRNLDDVGTIATATSSTASSYGIFGDDKLFAFLMNEYDMQTVGKDMSLTVKSLETASPDSRRQVVRLFELLRRELTTTKLAEKMQLYLVSKLDIKSLVLDAWLQSLVSPTTIFDILRVENELSRVSESEPVVMFTLWLEYVKMYWDHVSRDYVQDFFGYSAFVSLLQTKAWSRHVTTVLGSIASGQMLQIVQQPGFGNSVDNLAGMWKRWLSLHAGATPQFYFSNLSPSGKFKVGDADFLQGVLFIDLYRTRNTFTNKEIYNLLSPTNSYEEITGLFRWLQHFRWVQDLANGMLEYLTHPSTVLNVAEMTPAKYWQIFLPEGVMNVEYNFLLLRWFKYATAYFGSDKDELLQPAELAVYKLLQENVPANQYADVLKVLKLGARRDGMSQPEGLPPHKKLRGAF